MKTVISDCNCPSGACQPETSRSHGIKVHRRPSNIITALINLVGKLKSNHGSSGKMCQADLDWLHYIIKSLFVDKWFVTGLN